MNAQSIWLRTFANLGMLLSALSAAWLLAAPAAAFPVRFDAPSGYGLSSETAESAIAAGFTRLTPIGILTASAAGLVIGDPQVIEAELNGAPSNTNPITATSRWTVQNGGSRAFQDAWLVFLGPVANGSATYSAPLIGIDLQTGQWGIVEVSVGSGEAATEYFYPAVRLGNVAAGGDATFNIHHLIGTSLIRQGGDLILPKYGVGALGIAPGPAALPLLGMLLAGLALRRGSAA